MAHLSIPRELVKSGLLRTNLHGVRTVLARELGLKDLPISLDDKIKKQLANEDKTSYPYGWIVPTDAQVVKDSFSNRAVQRTGHRVGTYGASRNTSRVGFIFPIRIGCELHYFDDSADRAFHISETFLLLSALNNLTFDVKYGNQFVLNTRIEVPDNTTIPLADTGDTTKPGAIEIIVQLIVHTYAGFFKDVSSVYDVDPIIGTNIESVNGSEDTFTDYISPIEEFTTNDPRSP